MRICTMCIICGEDLLRDLVYQWLHIGFFFNRLRIIFFIGWHSNFEKIIGWLLIGFSKTKKMLGCGMIGFSILIKIIGWEYSVSTFLSKNARLDFNRFFVKNQKMLGWALIGFCFFFFIKYSVQGYSFWTVTNLSFRTKTFYLWSCFVFVNGTKLGFRDVFYRCFYSGCNQSKYHQN